MNFLGMGTMEIFVILLLAFIFLGPHRMSEAARFLGKMAREARRMSAELPDLVLDEEEEDDAAKTPTLRGGRKSGGSDTKGRPSKSPETGEDSAGADAPTASRPAREAPVEDDAEAAPKQEQA